MLAAEAAGTLSWHAVVLIAAFLRMQPLTGVCHLFSKGPDHMVAAGFHNAVLYEGLRSSIPPLVALLRDDEDKTRANAAGALGNLVRNSGLLCQSLIQANALQVSRILPDATLFLMTKCFIQAITLQVRRILADAKMSLMIADSPKH